MDRDMITAKTAVSSTELAMIVTQGGEGESPKEITGVLVGNGNDGNRMWQWQLRAVGRGCNLHIHFKAISAFFMIQK